MFFLGITVLAVVGNAAEYITAIYFARKNQMGMVMSITAGSSIQVALLVAPILMLSSFAIGKPMNLIFGSPLELVAVASTVFAVNTIAQDGETSWFEGILLVGIYAILVVAFFYVAPGTPLHMILRKS
jgi:Ca2+:H+ antiporter